MGNKNISFMNSINTFDTLAKKYKDNEERYQYLNDIKEALCEVELATSNFYRVVNEIHGEGKEIN